jgi:hypothetical protein
MSDEQTPLEIVRESALQLWAAAQTDFDPFEVPPSEWGPDTVPVRDVDIAVDTHLDLEEVREALGRLDGVRLVVGRDAGRMSVTSIIPDDVPL